MRSDDNILLKHDLLKGVVLYPHQVAFVFCVGITNQKSYSRRKTPVITFKMKPIREHCVMYFSECISLKHVQLKTM